MFDGIRQIFRVIISDFTGHVGAALLHPDTRREAQARSNENKVLQKQCDIVRREVHIAAKLRIGEGEVEIAGGRSFAQLAATERVWFWTMLMAVGLLIGSFMALFIASTRIVLPYDEDFVGLRREQFAEINARLLLFMAHDRVSLAGAMIALGVMYLGLSVRGIRAGMHWAQQSVFISAFAGFATFFLFLGYGLRDWNVRVLLRKLGEARGLTEKVRSWAIVRNPGRAEQELWRAQNIEMHDVDLEEFVTELERHL